MISYLAQKGIHDHLLLSKQFVGHTLSEVINKVVN